MYCILHRGVGAGGASLYELAAMNRDEPRQVEGSLPRQEGLGGAGLGGTS